MRDRSAIFLDLDGVLTDNGPSLAAAFRRASGELLAARFGGVAEAWGEAHDEYRRHFAPTRARLTPAAFYRWEAIDGVRGTLAAFRHPATVEDDECAALGAAIDDLARSYALDLGGAAAAVRSLRGQYGLHMASGNSSRIIEASLQRMRVRDHFAPSGVMCGCDLVGVLKTNDSFYPRVFDLAGVRAQDAIVVDDTPAMLARAKRTGAATVLIARPGAAVDAGEGIDLVLPSLGALVGTLGVADAAR